MGEWAKKIMRLWLRWLMIPTVGVVVAFGWLMVSSGRQQEQEAAEKFAVYGQRCLMALRFARPDTAKTAEGQPVTIPDTLHIKLASLVVHCEEALSDNRSPVDFEVIQSIVDDPEVVEWLRGFDPALLPVKR